MKRFGFIAIAIALLATTTQANAAQGPTAAQFKALQKQVKTLQTSVTKLESELNAVEIVTSALLACNNAVIADEFQATWTIVDQISSATQAGKTYFGPQTAISDANSCPAFKITRTSTLPPNVSIFSSLVSLLTT